MEKLINPQKPASWCQQSLLCALLLGITLVGFWPVGQLGFLHYDDYGENGYVVDNLNVQQGITADPV